ncbi:MAG: HDOD domain-containing protein [Kiritimatiellae bacterium]|nr:HDOD domain-containing protein [Kiritimatiellia bacterium]
MDWSDMTARLATIHNLPTLPTVIGRLNNAIHDPDSEARQVAAIIEDDPAISARVMKVVNSAFYGVEEPIASLQQAITALGFVAISNIALSTMVFSVFGKKGQRDFNREEFWRHSICTGIAANVLQARCREHLQHKYAKDMLHLAGLLHDIGKIIYEQFFHFEFMNAIARCAEQDMPLYEAEAESIGLDHADVGAWLAKRWFLSDEFVDVVRWHHDPMNEEVKYPDIVAICHIANYLCNREKLGDSGDNAMPIAAQGAWQKLGISEDDIPAIADEVREKAGHSEVLLAFV